MLCNVNNANGTVELSDWCLNFMFEQDQSKLAKIINAADFFEFSELYEACKSYFIFLINSGSTDSEIRKMFQLADDLTSEQKKEIYNIGVYTLRIK